MSIADTAEYQLEQLAKTMTEAHEEANTAGWCSADFQDGFEAALDAIALGMGLKMNRKLVFRS